MSRRNHSRKHKKSNRRHMRGGFSDITGASTDASSEMNGSPVSQASGMSGGRRSRSRRSRSRKGTGKSDRKGGRARAGGFLQTLPLILKDAIVPFSLLYGLKRMKTKKNRVKNGGDDIA